MEIWFLSAIAGAVLAGVSNFFFKIAASRGYNATLFTFYSGIASVALVTGTLFFFPYSPLGYGYIALFVFIGGMFSAVTNIGKVLALRHIDSTIYFPLFKLLAPALAIVLGVVLFSESFSRFEWFGMMLGLTVPLLLITKAENSRQNNLLAGLFFVLITGIISAGVAAVNKFSIDLLMPEIVTLLYSTFGISAGTLVFLVHKEGIHNLKVIAYRDTSAGLFAAASLRSIFITAAVFLMLYAFAHGGTLAVVQTIHSMYILIPIVLAIVFYGEHWNLQKAVAIVLSVAALGLLG